MSGGSSVSSNSSAFNGTHSRVLVRLIVGNKSEKFPHPTPLGHTHRWTVYVKAVGPLQFTDRSFIKRVAFVLHESFENPTRVVKEPPFQLSETGYGCFVMPIKIHFAGVDKTITINHELILSLEKFGEYNIEHKVELKDPTPEFYALVQKYCPKKVDKEVAKMRTISTKSQPAVKAAEKKDGSTVSKPVVAKEKEIATKKSNEDKKRNTAEKPLLKADPSISSKPTKSTPTSSKKHPRAADEGSGNVSDTSTSTIVAKDSSEKSLSRDIPSPAPRSASAVKMPSLVPESSSKKPTKTSAVASNLIGGLANETSSVSMKKSKKDAKIADSSKIADELPGPSSTPKGTKKSVLLSDRTVDSAKKKKQKKKELETTTETKAGELSVSDRERMEKEAREKIAARLFEDDIPLPSTSHQNLSKSSSMFDETREGRKKLKKKAKEELFGAEEVSRTPKVVAEKKRSADADGELPKREKSANAADTNRTPKNVEREKMKKSKEGEQNSSEKRPKANRVDASTEKSSAKDNGTKDKTKISAEKSSERSEKVEPKIADKSKSAIVVCGGKEKTPMDFLEKNEQTSAKKKAKKRSHEESDMKIERKSSGPTPPSSGPTTSALDTMRKRKLLDNGNVKTEPNSPCRVPAEFGQRPHSAISLAPSSRQPNGTLSHHSPYSGISPSTSSTSLLHASVRGENGVEYCAESDMSSSPASDKSKSNNEHRLKALSKRMSVIDNADMMLKVASALIENDPTAVSIDASHNMDFDLSNLKERTIGLLEEVFADYHQPSSIVENGISKNHSSKNEA